MATHASREPARFDEVREPAFRGLDRIAIRTRESAVAASAWSLSISTAQGQGRIALVETRGGAAVYRGEGLFLGWPQSELEIAYRSLRPPPPPSEPDAGQFG